MIYRLKYLVTFEPKNKYFLIYTLLKFAIDDLVSFFMKCQVGQKCCLCLTTINNIIHAFSLGYFAAEGCSHSLILKKGMQSLKFQRNFLNHTTIHKIINKKPLLIQPAFWTECEFTFYRKKSLFFSLLIVCMYFFK